MVGVFLNVDVEFDFKIMEEYKIFVICIGIFLMELFLIVRILDKFVIIFYIVLGIFFKLFILLVFECEFFFFFLKSYV